MKFLPTALPDAFVIELEPVRDDRGLFARTWCRAEFAAHGVRMEVVQASVSRNPGRGTLRGLHFQWPPSREAKLVRCQRGRIHDVIVDLRPQSATFCRHFAVELDAARGNALYVPAGFAHGFQTLVADCEVQYMMSDRHRPELADGVRFDDPAFAVSWPLPPGPMAARDRDYPDFRHDTHARRYSDALARAGTAHHEDEPAR